MISERINLRRWVGWGAATLVIAVLVHIGIVRAFPHVLMARALVRLGTVNAMHAGRWSDASSRAVVRPSPDLLYAACPFDLSQGPLEVTAAVPHWTYWSVAVYDAETNNFFVRNNGQITSDALDMVLQPPGAPPAASESGRIAVTSPTTRGLVLLRLLIDDEKHRATLDAMRHQARCSPIGENALHSGH